MFAVFCFEMPNASVGKRRCKCHVPQVTYARLAGLVAHDKLRESIPDYLTRTLRRARARFDVV